MNSDEAVVLKAGCVTVTGTFVQLAAPCPAVAVPLSRLVSMQTVGFGRSTAARRRLWAQGLLAAAGVAAAAWGWTIAGLAALAVACTWFVMRSRRHWTLVLRDASGAEYDVPFDDPEAGIRLARELRAHWAASAARMAVDA